MQRRTPATLVILALFLTAVSVPMLATAKGPEDPRPPECGYKETHLPGVRVTQYRSWWPDCRGEVAVFEAECGATSDHDTYIAGGWTIKVHGCMASAVAPSAAAPCDRAVTQNGLVSVYVTDRCGVNVAILEGLACLWDTRSKTVGKHPVTVTYYYCGNGQDPR